jgi:hypothetical protein
VLIDRLVSWESDKGRRRHGLGLGSLSR